MPQCRNAALLHAHLRAVQQRHARAQEEFAARRRLQQQESLLRQQQDAEYQATLQADQERERLLQEERQAIQAAQEALEAEARARTEAAAAERRAAEALSQEEPPAGTAKDTTTIRFVLPGSGSKLNRRFYSHQTVAALKAFVRLHYCELQENETDTDTESSRRMGTIGLSTSFPRRTYNDESDQQLTLEEAGLSPQAVLMVQDLDV